MHAIVFDVVVLCANETDEQHSCAVINLIRKVALKIHLIYSVRMRIQIEIYCTATKLRR